jgi:hypothetical protein
VVAEEGGQSDVVRKQAEEEGEGGDQSNSPVSTCTRHAIGNATAATTTTAARGGGGDGNGGGQSTAHAVVEPKGQGVGEVSKAAAAAAAAGAAMAVGVGPPGGESMTVARAAADDRSTKEAADRRGDPSLSTGQSVRRILRRALTQLLMQMVIMAISFSITAHYFKPEGASMWELLGSRLTGLVGRGGNGGRIIGGVGDPRGGEGTSTGTGAGREEL